MSDTLYVMIDGKRGEIVHVNKSDEAQGRQGESVKSNMERWYEADEDRLWSTGLAGAFSPSRIDVSTVYPLRDELFCLQRSFSC